LECTNLDYSQREKKLGRPPPLRLWPTAAHMHTVSWWAAVLQVAGILVSCFVGLLNNSRHRCYCCKSENGTGV